MPFYLIEAHETLSRYPTANRQGFARRPDPAYFSQAAVWKDIKRVFEAYLADHPNDHYERSRMARFACWAKDWKTAQTQFETLGENAHLGALGGKEYAETLKKSAASQGT